MVWTQEKAKEIIETINTKIIEDQEFRARFKADAKGTIAELAGMQLPSGIKINVVDLDDADITVTLPKTQTDELSDLELEGVAGGKSEAAKDIFGILTFGISNDKWPWNQAIQVAHDAFNELQKLHNEGV